MELKHPFQTSFGTMKEKEFLLIEAVDQAERIGYGESVAFTSPWYTEETLETTIHMLENFLIPRLLHRELSHPADVDDIFKQIRRNKMAKASVEGAIWDLHAKQKGISLAEALGGTRKSIDVGISIGMKETLTELLETIEAALETGYKRIKLKIGPGHDYEWLKGVRKHFPDIPLMADANSAYRLEDIEQLKRLDQFNLMMIEQPLAHDDIIDHARLQKQIDTPICLDESIHSAEDVRKAVELGSCKIINVKTGRVGGLTEAKRIHDYCKANDIDMWCGGMLEAGVGRAQNVALTSLSQFTLPGDTAGSANYWYEDIIHPEVVVKDGQIQVPEGPGIGYEINEAAVEKYQISESIYK